jgi:hypothetical protein
VLFGAGYKYNIIKAKGGSLPEGSWQSHPLILINAYSWWKALMFYILRLFKKLRV